MKEKHMLGEAPSDPKQVCVCVLRVCVCVCVMCVLCGVCCCLNFVFIEDALVKVGLVGINRKSSILGIIKAPLFVWMGFSRLI